MAVVVVLASLLGAAAPAGAQPTQPPQPTSGFGGTERHLAGNVGVTAIDQVQTVLNPDGDLNGTRVWVFRPPALRDGASAPVVVYLHGFALLAPDIYADHILHLVRQGLIVVYPQINQGGLNLLGDNNQSAMLDRAIASTNTALAWLGSSGGERHLFGHSLGGLLGATWTHRGGPGVQSLVLANPSTSAPPVGSGLPWQTMASATTSRTMILTGEDDTIAAPSESDALFDVMTSAASRIVYEARSDARGNPASERIVADHSAPAQDFGFLATFPFSLFQGAFGGPAKLDALDHRYYWAALDASIDGRLTVAFDLGLWSDGVGVSSPVVRRQAVPSTPAAPTLQATAGDQQVSLSWTPGADGGAPVTAHRVHRNGVLLATVAAPGTTYLDTTPSNGTTYTYEVSAVNLAGEGPRSAGVDATPQAPPPPPPPPWQPPTTPTFSDVGLQHPFFSEVEWLADQGIAQGYDDGTFRPSATVTRQAFAAFLQRLAGADDGPSPSTPTFSDVGPGHPFFAAIEWAAAGQIVTGWPDGTFRPGATVTRQASVAFLQRLADATGAPPPANARFTDVGPGHPFFAAIEWAASVGLARGYDDRTFRPGAPVTRQATAALLFRWAALDT